MRVVLQTERGWSLAAQGDMKQSEPEFSGAERLRDNRVVATNLWAYACTEKGRRLTRDNKLRAELEKQARAHADLTTDVADLVDRAGSETRSSWCSACFEHTEHRKVDSRFSVPTYLCEGCGAATLSCAAPHCDNMATRGFGAVRIPRYCAEHRHELASFERGSIRLDDLTAYEELLKFDKHNLAKTTKLAGGVLAAAGVMTGVGLAAAPMIGGFIGTTVGGYSGAAATSYGLALLGGGSIAAGGLGMAGGTAVVAAAGAGLGGIVGARLTSAYVSEDDAFKVVKLKDGADVPVIVCSGFLTETAQDWGEWQRIITGRYPDSPVYRVHWGAEELAALTAIVTGNVSKAGIAAGIRNVAMHASKSAVKVAAPIGTALIFADLAKNPWWRARQRATKTGAIVADLIARTNMPEVVLVGHSLGARAMIATAESLATNDKAPKVREAHLLGAAVGANGDWTRLNDAVEGSVFNYHSGNDNVLKFFYSAVQGGQKAAGYSGMNTRLKRIENIDVTKLVPDHSAYCKSLALK